MVAARSAIRLMGLPCLDLWVVVIGREVALDLLKTPSLVHVAIKAGQNLLVRLMSRYHGVDVVWIHYMYH